MNYFWSALLVLRPGAWSASSLLGILLLLPWTCWAETPIDSAVNDDDPLCIALPGELIAVAGLECNIYFDDVALMLNPANYATDVTCAKGRQQSERWTWTPTKSDCGEHPWKLEIRDDRNRTISHSQTIIRVVGPDAMDRSLSWLAIGDSLTHVSIYTQHALDLSRRFEGPRLTLIGTHGLEEPPGANRHEGYGGWTAQRFVTHFAETARHGDYRQRGSPFLFPQADGTPKLDFSRYCQEVNAGKFPDAVTIFLGPNDVFWFTDDTIEAGIATMLGHFDQLIEMVKTASPKTRVGVLLPVPPAASQDAFGSNYGSSQTRWQYRRNQHALVRAMLKRYAARRDEGVDLIGTHACLDAVHNYPVESVTANAQSDATIVRQNNGVHPSAAGYRQIGDCVFAWLLTVTPLN